MQFQRRYRQHAPGRIRSRCVISWSDITALYVARYGGLIVGTAIFVRTCQHTDGWTDLPKVASALIPT